MHLSAKSESDHFFASSFVLAMARTKLNKISHNAKPFKKESNGRSASCETKLEGKESKSQSGRSIPFLAPSLAGICIMKERHLLKWTYVYGLR